MFKPTALIYSSHNRGEYLHKNYIIQPALESHHNKTIFFLPMSMNQSHQQHYSYDTFKWYFNKFEKYGLKHSPFFWNDHLRKEDTEILFDQLHKSEVVILGGGNSELGMYRYRKLGEHFYGDRHLFQKILKDRQLRGKLTVGFSAGADQLSQYLSSAIDDDCDDDPNAFALAKNIIVTLHHEPGREWELKTGARRFPHCMVFGLPNDSGILVAQGVLSSGNLWQIIDFVIDKSWDLQKDHWHIKTRSGLKIEHFYSDGRHWSFDGGDRMIRVMSPDNRWQDAWVLSNNRNHIIHYGTQMPTFFHSIEHILESH